MLDKQSYQILRALDTDTTLSNQQLASMMDLSVEEIVACREKLERDGVVCGYRAVINWEKTERNLVTARIEVKVIPKSSRGFEELAYQISQFSEVETCYLMSGGYDIAVTISGKTFRDIALFVAHRLAPLDGVQSTATHFVLRRYKERGIFLMDNGGDEREVLS